MSRYVSPTPSFIFDNKLRLGLAHHFLIKAVAVFELEVCVKNVEAFKKMCMEL